LICLGASRVRGRAKETDENANLRSSAGMAGGTAVLGFCLRS
jgi:hypothetical protein